MYTALVPVDESETRARRAANVVTSLPGESEELNVVVLSVSEKKQQPWFTEAEINTTEGHPDQSAAPESVDVAYEILENHGVSVEKRYEYGDPPKRILAVAEEIVADVIVMCSRRQSPTGKALFGSVTQSVMLESQRPIVLLMDE